MSEQTLVTDYSTVADLYIALGFEAMREEQDYVETHPSAQGITLAAALERNAFFYQVRARYAPREAALLAAHGWTAEAFEAETMRRWKATR
jgi:hypothetical protein